MNVADGTVISTFMPTHNHEDWIRFLTLIQKKTRKDKDIHLILDNYGAHKTPEVRAWLAKHQRFHLHFTPTSSSWLNQVERFFRHPRLNTGGTPLEDNGSERGSTVQEE